MRSLTLIHLRHKKRGAHGSSNCVLLSVSTLSNSERSCMLHHVFWWVCLSACNPSYLTSCWLRFDVTLEIVMAFLTFFSKFPHCPIVNVPYSMDHCSEQRWSVSVFLLIRRHLKCTVQTHGQKHMQRAGDFYLSFHHFPYSFAWHSALPELSPLCD